MLAPSQETFRGNKIAIAGVVLLTLLFLIMAYNGVRRGAASSDFSAGLVFLVAAGLLGCYLAWLFSLRVSLHPDGVSKQTWLGSKEMRWDDVERFYYRATKRSVNFIPIGTYHSFRIMDREGNKMSLGTSVERPAELGQKLISGSFGPLYKKAAELFDSGAELDFGPIKLSGSRGLKVRRLFRYKEIALNQVAEYRIDTGHFYIFKVGEKRATGLAIGQIPNAFVLRSLLDAIYGRQA